MQRSKSRRNRENRSRSRPRNARKNATRNADTNSKEIGLTDIAKLLFGPAIVSQVIQRKLSVRDIWEISTPTTQCKNTVGEVGAQTKCWICDLKITTRAGMKPECEHVLPVAQAAIYLKLYHPAIDDMRWVQHEYGWAHVVCNQEKSDICALVNVAGEFRVDKQQIKNLLGKIYHSTRSDSANLKAALREKYPTMKEFIVDRTDIVASKYEDIIRFITRSRGPHESQSANLITLAGVSGLSDLSILRPSLHGLLNPAAVNAMIAETQAAITTHADRFVGITDVSSITHMIDFYDDIGDKVVEKLSKLTSDLPRHPKYKEYFAKRGINSRNPVASLNPQGFQADIFKIIIGVYPSLYRRLQNDTAIKNIITDFICVKILDSAFYPNSNAGPRSFIDRIKNDLRRLSIGGGNIYNMLNDEYNDVMQIDAAEALLSMRANDSAAAALALTALRSRNGS